MNPLVILAAAAGLLLYMNGKSAPELIPVETKRQLLAAYIQEAAKSSPQVQVFLTAIGSMSAAEIEDCYTSLITHKSHNIKPDASSSGVLQLWGRLAAIATKYGIEQDLLLGN